MNKIQRMEFLECLHVMSRSFMKIAKLDDMELIEQFMDAKDKAHGLLEIETKETGFPKWYLDESIPRLKRLDELAVLCAFDKSIFELTNEQREARREWDKLMEAQMKAEIEVGL